MLFPRSLLLILVVLLASCGTYPMNVSRQHLDDRQEVYSVVLKSGDSVAFGVFGGRYIAQSRIIEGQSTTGSALRISIDSVKRAYVESYEAPTDTSPVVPFLLLPAALYVFLLIFGHT